MSALSNCRAFVRGMFINVGNLILDLNVLGTFVMCRFILVLFLSFMLFSSIDLHPIVVTIVFRTGPEIEPAKPSVQWFNGPTVRNRLNCRFDCLNRTNRTGHRIIEPVYIYIW